MVTTQRSVWNCLTTVESELETKLAKLEPLCGMRHPSIFAVREDLSRIYYDRRKYREAELVDRKLVELYNDLEQDRGIETRVLDAFQRVVDALIAQGQYIRAQRLNWNLLSAFIQRSLSALQELHMLFP